MKFLIKESQKTRTSNVLVSLVDTSAIDQDWQSLDKSYQSWDRIGKIGKGTKKINDQF